jgi:hypothetical protein
MSNAEAITMKVNSARAGKTAAGAGRGRSAIRRREKIAVDHNWSCILASSLRFFVVTI